MEDVDPQPDWIVEVMCSKCGKHYDVRYGSYNSKWICDDCRSIQCHA